jgi:cysteine desulfuration protein SufE
MTGVLGGAEHVMTIDEVQDAIVEKFGTLDDWLEKYEYLVGLGEELPPADEGLRTEKYALPGCQSRVWIRAERHEGMVRFAADSDSAITKGILALLLRVLDGRRPADIARADLYFLEKTGLSSGLSPTRANGVATIVGALKDMSKKWEGEM